MKSIQQIISIDDAKYIEKLNKYIAEISISDEPEASEYWLSKKQANALFKCLNTTPDDAEYPLSAPTKTPVYAAFEQRNEYKNFIWCSSGKDAEKWLTKAFIEEKESADA